MVNYTNLYEILCVVREYGVIQCAAIDDRVQEFVFTMEVAASAHQRNVGCTVKCHVIDVTGGLQGRGGGGGTVVTHRLQASFSDPWQDMLQAHPLLQADMLEFRHMLEAHELGQQILATVNAKLIDRGLMLKTGTVVDATLIAAPSSTKNDKGERDPEMHQTKKGNQWHFGMKAHIGVDAASGLVHTVTTTAANAHDVTQAHALLHGEEEVVFADSGYRGVEKREEIEKQHPDVDWQIAMMPGKRKALDKTKPSHVLRDKLEKLKASIRAKVEHPFRVIKCQFGHRKTRYRGLAKNTSQLLVMFALSNLWMVRKRILQGAQA